MVPNNSLSLITYNIRKGKGASGRARLSEAIGAALAQQAADVVLTQEVFHPRHASHGPAQSEHLGTVTGLESYYAPNKHRRIGHHGNATLTHLPVEEVENHDVSTNRVERRGVLYTRLRTHGRPLHIFNTHLGLNHRQRRHQICRIRKLIAERTRPDEPVLLAGDFNDWSRRLDRVITSELGLENAFGGTRCPSLRTWPSRRPVFNLDRVYVRNLAVHRVERLSGDPWHELSDHLPLRVELTPG